MLKSWSITNFKPIVDSGELTLAPVTVFAGLNSAGKSSLLQSILMVAQTLSSPLHDRVLMPNGPIVQLGTFSHVLNHQLGSRRLIFSMEYAPPANESAGTATVLSKLSAKRLAVTATFDVTSPAVPGALGEKLEVEALVLHVYADNSDIGSDLYRYLVPPENLSLKAAALRMSEQDLASFLSGIDQSLSANEALSDGNAHQHLIHLWPDNGETADPLLSGLVRLNHFLPAQIYEKVPSSVYGRVLLEMGVRTLLDADVPASPFGEYMMNRLMQTDVNEPIPDTLRASIVEILHEETIASSFQGSSLLNLASWFHSLTIQSSNKRKLAKRLQDTLISHLGNGQNLRTNLKGNDSYVLWSPIGNQHTDILVQGVNELTRFFASRVRYLGPLRVDPQSIQRFAPSSELDEVGPQGEYAAAAYEANAQSIIQWPDPLSLEICEGPVQSALNSWICYLGVATEISAEMAGQRGVTWQVTHRENQNPLPLSAVGVGVSQVLPILVMGLLAPKHSLLIIEQPELHLHPRVQARLGDFFLGLARCQKQCLIETHSENLVNQLRYHIVKAGGQEQSDCQIYFVDQDEAGASRFEAVQISPRGNILNWPDGFFDESQLQEDRISAAGVANRVRSSRNG